MFIAISSISLHLIKIPKHCARWILPENQLVFRPPDPTNSLWAWFSTLILEILFIRSAQTLALHTIATIECIYHIIFLLYVTESVIQS